MVLVNESEGDKVIKTSDAKMKLEGGRPFLGYSVSNEQGSLRPLAKHFLADHIAGMALRMHNCIVLARCLIP